MSIDATRPVPRCVMHDTWLLDYRNGRSSMYHRLWKFIMPILLVELTAYYCVLFVNIFLCNYNVTSNLQRCVLALDGRVVI